MSPSACLIDPAPDKALLAPLSALFSPLFCISPIPDAGDGPILPLSPPLDGASALRLGEIAAALASGEAARHGERLRGLVADLLAAGKEEPESGGAIIQSLRRDGATTGRDPLLRERLTLILTAQAHREQAELERDLARITRRHRAVFADLREDDAEAQDAAPAQSGAATSSERQAYIRAWLRLLRHTPLPCPNPRFITFDAALADALLAEFRQDGGAPVALPPISLPADGARQNRRSAETPCLFAVLREAE